MIQLVYVLILYFLLILCNQIQCIKKGVHECVHITTKLATKGDGSTSSSCLSCDPALPTCHSTCQKMVDQMYHVCDDVCLPYNYYYDANYKISGCWNEVKPNIKIAVERCGCNPASNNYSINNGLILISIIITIYIFIIN